MVLKKSEYFAYTTYMLAAFTTCYLLPMILMIIFYKRNISTEMNEKEKELARFNKKVNLRYNFLLKYFNDSILLFRK